MCVCVCACVCFCVSDCLPVRLLGREIQTGAERKKQWGRGTETGGRAKTNIQGQERGGGGGDRRESEHTSERERERGGRGEEEI